MNTWNTFRDESYTYPNLCAKCAAPGPEESWELRYKEIEFPEGRPITPYDQKPRNYNTFITQVPVCGGCLAAMHGRGRFCWLLGAAIGLVAAFIILLAYHAQGNAPDDSIWSASFVGIFAAVVSGYLLKTIFAGGDVIAKYNGREQKLKFANKEFQAQYDRLNFQYSPITGQYAGTKGW
jgi:hypothetical protein